MDLERSTPDYRAHFDDMATEIVEQIFSYACPYIDIPGRVHPYDPDHIYIDPSMLLMVCRRWRAIINSYPLLWTSLNIYCFQVNKKMWGKSGLNLLRNYLNRSGDHPLEIYIDADDHTKFLPLTRIFDCVKLHSNRWRSLTLIIDLGHRMLHSLDSLKGQLSRLEYLGIDLFSVELPNRRNRKCTAFLTAPLLKSLQVNPRTVTDTRVGILRHIQLPWTQISEFVFSDDRDFIGKHELPKMLTSMAQSLSTLTFPPKMQAVEEWPFSVNEPPIALPVLRRLYFGDSTGILELLACPSLEELEMDNGDPQELATFLDNFACALTHFSLDFSGHPLEFDTVLHHSSLSTLDSVSLLHPTEPILNLFIFDARSLFPLLETLHVELKVVQDQDSTYYLSPSVNALCKVVKSRTQAIHPNGAASTINTVCNPICNGGKSPRSSMKSLSLIIYLGRDTEYFYAEEQCQEIQLLCISRNMDVTLEIIAVSDEERMESVADSSS